MANGGKLNKLIKSALKKIMQSFKPRKANRSPVPSVANNSNGASMESSSAAIREELHPVYVGKSRRKYLLPSRVIENPVFRELMDHSSGFSDYCITVKCEVVLFEHLLWMLENGDPHTESLDELVELYSC
ncbi:OLC1v1019014C1 [Oldenlandia corymbosa var. corymbosa]|uniref:OLC1v1019014C1 n=1 Tax=Oldenlandia corymbosa var. corymbosa TaxID=529605 RepID=A0AAV1ED42_OLDCO|nr:OLC1v1019014C1 [Oldenlandia corymbosa var. corymbosa]